jgi:hypothetical protein
LRQTTLPTLSLLLCEKVRFKPLLNETSVAVFISYVFLMSGMMPFAFRFLGGIIFVTARIGIWLDLQPSFRS